MHLNACSVWTSSGFFFTQLIFFSVLLPSPSHPPSVFHLYQSLHSIPSSLLSRLFHTISTVASYSEGACLHLSTSQPPQVHSSSTCLDKLLSGRSSKQPLPTGIPHLYPSTSRFSRPAPSLRHHDRPSPSLFLPREDPSFGVPLVMGFYTALSGGCFTIGILTLLQDI